MAAEQPDWQPAELVHGLQYGSTPPLLQTPWPSVVVSQYSLDPQSLLVVQPGRHQPVASRTAPAGHPHWQVVGSSTWPNS